MACSKVTGQPTSLGLPDFVGQISRPLARQPAPQDHPQTALATRHRFRDRSNPIAGWKAGWQQHKHCKFSANIDALFAAASMPGAIPPAANPALISRASACKTPSIISFSGPSGTSCSRSRKAATFSFAASKSPAATASLIASLNPKKLLIVSGETLYFSAISGRRLIRSSSARIGGSSISFWWTLMPRLPDNSSIRPLSSETRRSAFATSSANSPATPVPKVCSSTLVIFPNDCSWRNIRKASTWAISACEKRRVWWWAVWYP